MDYVSYVRVVYIDPIVYVIHNRIQDVYLHINTINVLSSTRDCLVST